MADNRLNKTGLRYLLNKIQTYFATKAEVSSLTTRVDDIASQGGEPNTINAIKVNGATMTPDANKAVDISVPQSVTDLSDGGSYATKTYVDENGGKIDIIKVNGSTQTITEKSVDLSVPTQVSDLSDGNTVATKEYVSENGGKIDKVKVNGTEQTITNKEVNLSVPTTVSELTNDSGFQTATEVQTAINSAIGNIEKLTKKAVDTLPATGEDNVLYMVPSSKPGTGNVKEEYLWIDGVFEYIGNTETDLTGYWNETNLTALTTEEIDTLWESVFGS